MNETESTFCSLVLFQCKVAVVIFDYSQCAKLTYATCSVLTCTLHLLHLLYLEKKSKEMDNAKAMKLLRLIDLLAPSIVGDIRDIDEAIAASLRGPDSRIEAPFDANCPLHIRAKERNFFYHTDHITGHAEVNAAHRGKTDRSTVAACRWLKRPLVT